jgi:hypothetical protein
MATVTVDQMRDKLLTFDQLKAELATTEPVSSIGFPVGDSVRFSVGAGWNHSFEARGDAEVIPEVQVRVGKGTSQEFTLTKAALLEATSGLGMSKALAPRMPAKLLTDTLNYFYREGLASDSSRNDWKLLIAGENSAGVAFTKGSITPFSNVRLLDEIMEGIEKKYGKGTEVLADYKRTHSLQATRARLIVPEQQRIISGTAVEGDLWSTGIQFCNSLVGATPTSLDGYLFRWWCTNGSIDTHSSTGSFSRRGNTGEEVYEWARMAVDEVLGGLEPALDQVQALTGQPVGTSAVTALRDVFDLYKIPVPLRNKITEEMANAPELNMYEVMQAITQAANVANMDFRHVEQLMRAGGDLPHRVDSRCDSCHRITV